MIAFIQRMAGYLLTADTSEQVFFMLEGSGANGKSTFAITLGAILGEYAKGCDVEAFLHQPSTRIRADLADLPGMRLVTTSEPPQGRHLDESIIKLITGGEKISVRRLYGQFFEYLPKFKLMISANSLPQIVGDDHGIWRRVRVIPFRRIVSDEERKPNFHRELLKEKEGILAWAVKGCLEWQQQGLNPPDDIRLAINQYREDNDHIAQFISECLVSDPSKRISNSELQRIYRQYCHDNRIDALTPNALGRSFKKRGWMQAKTTGGNRVWSGWGPVAEKVPLT